MEFLVSHAFGAGQKKKQREYFVHGILLAICAGVPLSAMLIYLSFHLEWMGVNPAVADSAKRYSVVLALSLMTIFLFNVLRLHMTAQGKARPAMFLLVMANVLNAVLGYVLILGNWGAPQLGAEGAGWATVITRLVMLVCLIIYIYVDDRVNCHELEKVKVRFQPKVMKEMIRIGLPSAVQMTLEVGVFTLATTFAARLSASHLAAHQIVLNIASLTFMVPLGVGSSTAVLVGQAFGRKERKTVSQLGWRGLSLGIGFMAISCLALLYFSKPILSLFTTDETVILIGQSILLIAALFQLSDGIQTVGTGALRGLGDTRSPMILNLCGHWFIGLPLGLYLCFSKDWGLRGLWIGLSAGLTLVAVGVLGRWWYLSKMLRSRRRLEVV
jgi:MATE family multidrug resistance protein